MCVCVCVCFCAHSTFFFTFSCGLNNQTNYYLLSFRLLYRLDIQLIHISKFSYRTVHWNV